MKTLLISLSCAATVVGFAASDAFAESGFRSCHPPKTHTFTATDKARVFYSPRRDRTYGCLERTHKPVVLARGRSLPQVALAGSFAAVVTEYGAAAVRLADLRTGKVISFRYRVSDIPDLVLKPTGSAAWITHSSETNITQLLRDDRHAGPLPRQRS